MGRHAAPRRSSYSRLFRSTRVRAVLSLGAFVTIGSTGTLAYFSDSVAVPGTTFTSGVLDVQVTGQDPAENSYTWTALSATDLVPGESTAASIQVNNAGTVPFTYTAEVVGTGALVRGLTVQAYVGGTPMNGTTAANSISNNLRTGSCQGTPIGTSPVTLSTTDQPLIPATNKQELATETSQYLCLVATLATTADNALQGKTASVTVTLNALQLGAPTP